MGLDRRSQILTQAEPTRNLEIKNWRSTPSASPVERTSFNRALQAYRVIPVRLYSQHL